MRKEEPEKLIPNINKAKKLFKWKPTTSIIKGLKKTIYSYAKN